MGAAGAVQHAVQRAVLGQDLGNQFFDLGALGHVHAAVRDLRAERGQAAQALQAGGVEVAAAGDHDRRAGAAAGDVGDQRGADAAHAAGDQVHAAVAPGRGGVAEFDLGQRDGVHAACRDVRALARFDREQLRAQAGEFGLGLAQHRRQRRVQAAGAALRHRQLQQRRGAGTGEFAQRGEHVSGIGRETLGRVGRGGVEDPAFGRAG